MIFSTVVLSLATPETHLSGLSSKFINCDKQQVRELSEAKSESFLIRTQASASLLRGSNPKIVEYFGNKSQNRWTAFSVIRKTLLRNYDVTCSTEAECSGVTETGFVSNKDESNINICPSFFSKRLSGADSQAGALIALQTVFSTIGSTSFHVSTIAQVKILAQENAALAVDNAPSYGFFSESVYYDLK